MEKKLPDFLKEMLENQYEEENVNKIIEGYSKIRPVTLRVNTLKTTVENVEEVLKSNTIEYEKVSFIKNAFIIKNVRENILKELEIYENGEIYMQSLSSMLPPIILEPKEDEDILDMAAAPRRKNYRNSSTNK